MPEFKVHSLWPIPIYENFIPVKEKWKNAVRNIDYVRPPIDNSDISKDKYILETIPDFKDLKIEIKNHCEIYVRKFLHIKKTANFYFQNSWSNLHKPKEYSQIHYHGNSLISGVYYPILPKNSGDISFHRGHTYTNLFHQSIRFDYDKTNFVTTDQYVLNLKEGSITLFPSHLDHRVEENNSNEYRYSIAFNFYVRGKFGAHEYELEIK